MTEAWHVFALRALQGLFAGYGALALTMAADAAPRDRMAFVEHIARSNYSQWVHSYFDNDAARRLDLESAGR